MPNWKKVITSGSSAQLNHITVSGNISASLSSTGSIGHLMVGGGNFSSASLAAGGNGAMFKIPFGGYARCTNLNSYYVKTYGGGYYYYSANLGTTINDHGGESFLSANKYAQYVAEGGEKANKVNGWISPRRQIGSYNNESASMYLWKGTPVDGSGGNIAYTQMAPSQSFAGPALGYTNWRIDMDVHQDSRSLSDGDILVFGIKRTTGASVQSEYYDFNATLELEK